MKNIKCLINAIVSIIGIICIMIGLSLIVVNMKNVNNNSNLENISDYKKSITKLRLYNAESYESLKKDEDVSYIMKYSVLKISNNSIFNMDNLDVLDNIAVSGEKIKNENEVLSSNKDYKIGDTFTMSNSNQTIQFKVVGTFVQQEFYNVVSSYYCSFISSNPLFFTNEVYCDYKTKNDVTIDTSSFGLQIYEAPDFTQKNDFSTQLKLLSILYYCAFFFAVIISILLFVLFVDNISKTNILSEKVQNLIIFLFPIALILFGILEPSKPFIQMIFSMIIVMECYNILKCIWHKKEKGKL